MLISESKRLAKQQIKGNIGVLFVITLVVGLVGGAVGMIPIFGSLAGSLVVTPAFGLATLKIYLGMIQGEKPRVGDLFSQFGNFWAAFKVTFLVSLFTFLWSLLLIIPGIIKAFSYSQAMYILAEDPEMGALEAISRSKEMMKGYKLDLFGLNLSFIGWILLGILTLGIGFIWIIPYMSAAQANFYDQIKEEAVVEG